MRDSPSKPLWSLSSPPAPRRSKVRPGPGVGAEGCLPAPHHLGLPQATPQGMTPRSLLTTTPQSSLCAGTPMRTSTSTMRTVWMVCAAGPGVVEGLGGTVLPPQADPPPKRYPLSRSLQHCPLSLILSLFSARSSSLILSPLRLPDPHLWPPRWQSLCPGAASAPPDPTCTPSRATPTPAAVCQQRLWPFIHTDHGASHRVPWPATPNGC